MAVRGPVRHSLGRVSGDPDRAVVEVAAEEDRKRRRVRDRTRVHYHLDFRMVAAPEVSEAAAAVVSHTSRFRSDFVDVRWAHRPVADSVEPCWYYYEWSRSRSALPAHYSLLHNQSDESLLDFLCPFSRPVSIAKQLTRMRPERSSLARHQLRLEKEDNRSRNPRL